MLLASSLSTAAGEDDAVRAITAALRARHFQEALDLARSALTKSPKAERILVLEGMALTGLHKDGEALAVLKSAMKIAPDYVPALNDKGRALRDLLAACDGVGTVEALVDPTVFGRGPWLLPLQAFALGAECDWTE